MDVMFGLDEPMLSTIQQLMDMPEELEKAFNAPTRAYVRDHKAMANTPMDVKELPDGRILLTVDMPGVHANEIKVQV
jgi:HSP20 family protein